MPAKAASLGKNQRVKARPATEWGRDPSTPENGCQAKIPAASGRARKQGVVVGDARDAVAVPLAKFDAVDAPVGAVDVLDNDGLGPAILRNLGQVRRQHPVLIAFDVDLQDRDFTNGMVAEQGGEAPHLHRATGAAAPERSGALIAACRKQALAVTVADGDRDGGNVDFRRGVTPVAGEPEIEG